MPNQSADVLIVEDNATLRQVLSILLGQMGCKVRSAEDGFSALAEIRTELPDVILSDLYMPGMSGFEFLSVVRRRFPMVRAVAMSSAFSGDSVPPGIAADAFYEKATSPGALLKIMQAMTHVERPRAFQDSTTIAPIWIAETRPAGEAEASVQIVCPECLRTFSQAPGEVICVHETGCVHCNNSIHYAIVDTLDPTPTAAN